MEEIMEKKPASYRGRSRDPKSGELFYQSDPSLSKES
jgi:hypothetical protein